MNESERCLIGLVLAITLLGCSDAGLIEFSKSKPLVVRVIGRDFQWHFTYPGADGEFDTQDDVDSAQDLRIPRGYKVRLDVTSEDYLYAFRAPELDLRKVAVPGMTFSIKFKPDRAGRFELIVDPMCGFDFLHANRTMGHLVVAEGLEESGLTRWSP